MGLARETSDIKAAKHEQGKAFGTPYYIAPEQIRGLVEIGAILMCVALITLPVHRATVAASIASFEARRATIDAMRESGDGTELAASVLSMSDANAWLAKAKYWNNTLFDIWTPDAIESVEPIK